MSSITPLLPPASYAEAQQVGFDFGENVTGVSISVNGLPPSLSEYIAYDTLDPPNPFIAVTQDGGGKVVYDGGFPKFYNIHAPADSVTQFSELTGSFQYLYNAIEWVVNREKVQAGNRKILFIGDAVSGYAVKSTATNGFFTSFTRVCEILNYDLTAKDRNDYPGGLLDAPLAELDEYICVIYMGSQSTSSKLVTDRFINDMVTYRALGNGLIFITDHGPTYTTIEEAVLGEGSGFFQNANKIIVNFGAYFTGTVNRSPVNVGFLRTTYGDHPLYNNMLDTDSISAGGSESNVRVSSSPVTPVGEFTPIDLSEPGEYRINVLVVLENGEVETAQYTYRVMVTDDILGVSDIGTQLTSNRFETFKKQFDLSLINLAVGAGTLRGDISRNGYPMGTFTLDGDQTTYNWLSGDRNAFPVIDGDVIHIQVLTPYQFTTEIIVSGVTQPTPQGLSLAGSIAQMRMGDYVDGFPTQVGVSLARYVNRFHMPNNRLPRHSDWITHFRGGGLPLSTLEHWVYPTELEFNAASADIPVTYDTAIIADTNSVAIRENTTWSVIPEFSPAQYLGVGRRVFNIADGSVWLINSSEVIPQ